METKQDKKNSSKHDFEGYIVKIIEILEFSPLRLIICRHPSLICGHTLSMCSQWENNHFFFMLSFLLAHVLSQELLGDS